MNRKKQQSDLIFKLGLLLSPLQEIADHPEGHDAHSRARAGAKFFGDARKLESEVHSFTQGEPGHDYRREWRNLTTAFHTLDFGVQEHLDNPVALMALLKEESAAIIDGILAIPAPTDALILEAHTPFSTYCVVKDLCQTVAERLIWVDRYLDASVFYRYLRDVPINVHVTLLTWPGTKRNAKDFSEFMDVSRLYAAERGPDNYTLVVHLDIHDRWLCCDGQIYALGGSVKDASRKSYFTLSKVDPTVENFDKINQLLSTGTEIYGPTQPKHS
jgi:hypothetical protein